MKLKLRKQDQRGFALIMVISVLLLVTSMILAFFLSARDELSSSHRFEAGTRVVYLADTVTQIVQAQISAATSQADHAWASQPGMIRTWDTSGDPGSYYKLYSALSMVMDGTGYTIATDAPPANWNLQTAAYVDLNAPVVTDAGSDGDLGTSDDTLLYPITPPPADLDPTNGVPVDDPSTSGTQEGVAGYQVSNPPGFQSSDPVRPDNNPAPMPVEWIYLLEDGTLTVYDSSTPDNPATPASEAEVTFADNPPSASNRIVGRIAFWTDDETAKLNINTASEGTFWDVPKSSFNSEKRLALAIPVRNEFQRLPGHPATTSLSAFLGYLPGLDPPPAQFLSSDSDYVARVEDELSNSATWYDRVQSYIDLTPRVSYTTSSGDRSSRGGLARTTKTIRNSTGGDALPTSIWPGSDRNKDVAKGEVVEIDADRLYASVDELLFKKDPVSGARVRNAFGTASDPQVETAIRASPFFMTTQSRAPEVNLLGEPRVALWVQNESTRNTVDDLLAFASSLGQKSSGSDKFEYYFQRSNPAPLSPTAPAEKTDELSISRNQELYDYLKSRMGQSIPGYPGGLNNKWGTSGIEAVLVQAYDLLRSNVNTSTTPAALTPVYRYGAYRGNGSSTDMQGPSHYTVPTIEGSHRGMGRYPVLVGLNFIFIRSESVDASDPDNKMQVAVVPQFFNPTPGLPYHAPGFRIQIDGVDQLLASVPGTPAASFPASAVTRVGGRVSQTPSDGSEPYGFMHFAYLLTKPNENWDARKEIGNPTPDIDADYPFWAEYDLPASAPTSFNTTAGTVTVRLLSWSDGSTIQEYTIAVPQFDMPIPRKPASDPTFRGRMNDIGADTFIKLDDTDVVRSMILDPAGPTRGDFRMLALTGTVPNNWFTQFGSPGNTDYVSVFLRYNYKGDQNKPSKLKEFMDTYGTNYLHGSSAYAGLSMPAAPPGLAGATMTGGQPGDWSSGIGKDHDGGLFHRPESGNLDEQLGGFYHKQDNVAAGEVKTISVAPSRSLPSPIVFGSLLATNSSGSLQPWKSLLFNPQPAAGSSHPGFASGSTPPDHVFLDFFWMPKTDPWAISEPFSTAGQVNINHRLQPFGGYMTRRTAVIGAMRSLMLGGVENSSATATTEADNYKRQEHNYGASGHARHEIDLEATLDWMDTNFFDANEIFRSASQICEVPFTPVGAPINTFWNNHEATSDTYREQPYNALYSRITTKSNTYTIHYRVQALKQNAVDAGDAKWVEKPQAFVGEYRGSTTIERYIDPNDTSIPDYATASSPAPLSNFYRWRVLGKNRFAP